MKIKIDKNIPMPGPRRRYPLYDLEVGDSFFVPNSTPQKISGSIGAARKRWPDRTFSSRSVDGGVRVWRIK